MKWLLLSSFLLLNIFTSIGQVRKIIDRSLIARITINVPELKCITCKNYIDKFLLRNEGIVEIKTDYKQRKINITYIPALTNLDNIRMAIANAGYQADTVSANPDARKYLPICCLEKFTEKDVRVYIDAEKEWYRKHKKRYRIPKQHLCCYECDLVAKYRKLKK